MPTTITFEDPLNPPNPGAVRIYVDGSPVCCTDHGSHLAADVQIGWKIKRPGEPWLTVLSVVTE
jgi:hypothetical protein